MIKNLIFILFFSAIAVGCSQDQKLASTQQSNIPTQDKTPLTLSYDGNGCYGGYEFTAEQRNQKCNELIDKNSEQLKQKAKIKEKSDEEEQQKIIDNIQAHASKLLLKRESESKKLAKYYALTEFAEMCSVRSRYWINGLINGITVAASEKRNGLTNDEAKAFMALWSKSSNDALHKLQTGFTKDPRRSCTAFVYSKELAELDQLQTRLTGNYH